METPPATQMDMELFRNWVMPSASMPSVRELRSRIALYQANDLPRMIEIMREAEVACMVRLGDLKRQIRKEREEAIVPSVELDMSVLIWGEAVERWHTRITWLQNVRMYLEKEL